MYTDTITFLSFKISMETYRGWFIAEEERLVGKCVAEDFEIVATELGNFLWGMHSHSLGFYFPCSLWIIF